MSASMAEGMGALLAQHPITWKRRDDPENDRVYFEPTCGLCGVIGVHSPDRHRAEVLAANGYGSIRAAAAVGWDAAVGQMVYEDGTPVQVATNANPYRRPE